MVCNRVTAFVNGHAFGRVDVPHRAIQAQRRDVFEYLPIGMAVWNAA
jgi:hypothetical protein